MRLTRIFIWLLSALAMGLVGLYFYKFYNPKVMLPLRGEFVTLEGMRLYVTAVGDGAPVLFLHGFPYHSETYDKLMAQSWPGRRLIALDFPGAGMSKKKFEHPLTPEQLAAAVKQFLDQAGIESIDMVGHDLGGGVAIILAATFPRLVKQVVLIAPDSSAGSAAGQLGWWWRIPVLGEGWASLRLGRGLIRGMLHQAWPSGVGMIQDVERYARPLEFEGGREGFLALHRGRGGFNYTPYEERVRAPVLILWGAADHVLPLSDGRMLAKTLQADLKIVPNAGHLLQEEKPEMVGDWIRAFLKAPVLTPSEEN